MSNAPTYKELTPIIIMYQDTDTIMATPHDTGIMVWLNGWWWGEYGRCIKAQASLKGWVV